MALPLTDLRRVPQAAILGGPADRAVRRGLHPQQAGLPTRPQHHPKVAAARLHGPAGQGAGRARGEDGAGDARGPLTSQGRSQSLTCTGVEVSGPGSLESAARALLSFTEGLVILDVS